MNVWLLVPLLAALAQGSALSFLTLRGVQFEAVLVLVVLWGVVRGGRDGLIWAMVGGVVLDLLSLAPMGTHTIPLLIVAFLVGFTAATPFGVTQLLAAACTALAIPIYYGLQMLMLRLIDWPVSLGRGLSLLPVSLVLNVLLSVILLPIVRRLSWLAGDRDFEWKSRQQ